MKRYGFEIIWGRGEWSEKTKYPSQNTILFDNIKCYCSYINKFINDKVFFDGEDFVLIIDGVITNKNELNTNKNISWTDFLYQSFKNDSLYFQTLRGSFAGAVYYKRDKKLRIFTDHLGLKFVYYYYSPQLTICSLMMDDIFSILKENGIKYSLNIDSAKLLLTYGFMIEDTTICKEIKKVQPGSYVDIDKDGIKEEIYYTLDNTENLSITEIEALEGVDKYFRQAVERQFLKDKEYGYSHITTLSGGLDARMTSFVAHDMGFSEQYNITFSQTDYWDEIIPKQMADYMKHEWIFKALNNGIWLENVDEITKITGGNVLYYSLAHGYSMLKNLNFDDFGLIHTGQIGDVVVSTHFAHTEKFKFGDGAFSPQEIDNIGVFPSRTMPNKELSLYYYRYLNGTNNGIQYVYQFTETLSPFLDLDFLEYCLSIPSSIRLNHKLYKKWIINYYPDAAKFGWEKMMGG